MERGLYKMLHFENSCFDTGDFKMAEIACINTFVNKYILKLEVSCLENKVVVRKCDILRTSEACFVI